MSKAPALTLTNLKPVIGKLCPGVSKASTIAQFWSALDVCTAEPAPQPAPVPPPKTPAPSAWVRFDSIAPVARNYDAAAFVESVDYRYTPIRNHDDVASFRMDQAGANDSHADPIFGVDSSHLHRFVGRPVRSSYLPYQAIRSEETPVGEGGPINRSVYGFSPLIATDEAGAHWVLEEPVNHAGHPRGYHLYYKQHGPNDPFWQRHPELIRSPLPRGLRMLGGIKHYPVERWPWQHGPAPVSFGIYQGPVGNEERVPGTPETWRLAELLPHFTPGRFLKFVIDFPNLVGDFADSPSHVDHVAYFQPQGTVPADRRRCIPGISIIGFVRHPGFKVTRLRCSSDFDHPELPDGATMHGYFLEGWDDAFRERMQTVFDGPFSTSNGNFADGTRLKPRDPGKAFNPGLVRYEPGAAR